MFAALALALTLQTPPPVVLQLDPAQPRRVIVVVEGRAWSVTITPVLTPDAPDPAPTPDPEPEPEPSPEPSAPDDPHGIAPVAREAAKAFPPATRAAAASVYTSAASQAAAGAYPDVLAFRAALRDQLAAKLGANATAWSAALKPAGERINAAWQALPASRTPADLAPLYRALAHGVAP